MPYELTWEPEGVYWKYTGDLTGQEIIEATSLIYGDSRFDDLRYKLVDFMEMENIIMTRDDVALIAYQHRAAELSNPSVSTAIVMRPGCNLAETFASFFTDSNWEVKIFDNLDEANLWLKRESL